MGKSVYVKLEEIEIPANVSINDPNNYPHAGVFLIKFDDGGKAVIRVYNLTETTCGYELTNIPADGIYVDVDSMVSIKQIESECNAAKKMYDDFKKDLEHEYEIKKLMLESEAPKRMAVGEWVSGKTLVEIVKTLSHQETENRTAFNGALLIKDHE